MLWPSALGVRQPTLVIADATPASAAMQTSAEAKKTALKAGRIPKGGFGSINSGAPEGGAFRGCRAPF